MVGLIVAYAAGAFLAILAAFLVDRCEDDRLIRSPLDALTIGLFWWVLLAGVVWRLLPRSPFRWRDKRAPAEPLPSSAHEEPSGDAPAQGAPVAGFNGAAR